MLLIMPAVSHLALGCLFGLMVLVLVGANFSMEFISLLWNFLKAAFTSSTLSSVCQFTALILSHICVFTASVKLR